jgi:hypothetical protein
MAKYLLLKHYRGDHDIAATPLTRMDQWTPGEIEDHIAFMGKVVDDLRERGEFVDAQALSPEGTFVRYDGEGRAPVTDGPFLETKEAVGGYYLIEAGDLDEVMGLAARLYEASAGHSGVEIRPVVDHG